MVIDEARCLGVPVLTTETTSAHEMVTEMACGWVCENTQEALNVALCELLLDGNRVRAMKDSLRNTCPDNSVALAQLECVVQTKK